MLARSWGSADGAPRKVATREYSSLYWTRPRRHNPARPRYPNEFMTRPLRGSVAVGELNRLHHQQNGTDNQIAPEREHAQLCPRAPPDGFEQCQRRHAPRPRIYAVEHFGHRQHRGIGALSARYPPQACTDQHRENRDTHRQITRDLHHIQIREERGGHQNAGKEQQHADDEPGDNVEPRLIDPRTQYRLVIAQQQQEHTRAGQ